MHQKTRDTYNRSAGSLSDHYDEIGPREGDIKLAFTLARHPENARVLEIGCGNGRDARAILHQTPFYTGIDTSEKMIEHARLKAPKGFFEVADAVTYAYPDKYDIVFAFAPFRHMKLEEVTTVMQKVYAALKPGGVFYISSNYGAKYEHTRRQDIFGVRDIYLYNPTILEKHGPTGFKKIQEIFDTVDNQEWFEVAFQKRSD